MAGSLEAFKLFNSQQRKPRQPPSDTASTTTNSAETPSSTESEQSSDNKTPTSNLSEAAPEEVAQHQVAPLANGENGLKVCVANTMAYNQREQNYRELEQKLAAINQEH